MRTIYECTIMDENLDPEQIRQANEQLENLASNTESVNKQFTKTTDVSTDLNKTLAELHKKFEEFTKLTKNELIKTTEKTAKSQKDQIKEIEEFSDSLDDATEAATKSASSHEKYIQRVTESLGFIKDATGDYISAMKKQADDREAVESEIIKTIGKENYERIKQEDRLLEIEKKRAEAMKTGGPQFLATAKAANTLEGAIGQANSSIMSMVQASGVSATAYVGIGLALQGLEIGLVGIKKVLDASIDAQIAYTKSVLNGDRGQAVVAKRNEAIGKAQNDVIKQFGQLAISAGAAGIALTLMAGPIGIVAKVLGVALGGAAIAAGVYTQYTAKAADTALEFATQLAELNDKLYAGAKELGQTSLLASTGITGLKQDLEKLQFSFAEVGKFTAIVKNAGKELSLLGPGTVGGLNNFVKTAGDLIKSDLGKQLEYMGINNEKQAEHVLRFMAQQARLGIAQEKDQKKAAEAAGKYVVELDKLAVLTGATREEQEKARDQVMAIEELRAKMSMARNDEERALLKKQIDTVTAMYAAGAKEAAAGTARYIASGGRVVDEASAKMRQSARGTLDMIMKGQGTTSDQLRQFTGDVSAAQRKLAGVASISYDAVKDILPAGYAVIGDMRIRQEEFDKEANKMVAEGKAKTVDEALEIMRKSRDEEMKKQVELERAQRLEAIQSQKDVIARFGTATGLFREGVDAFVKATKPEVAKPPKAAATTAAETKAGEARATSQEKTETLAKINDDIDAAKKREKQLVVENTSAEERKKQQERIAELEKKREKAVQEEIAAANASRQAALEAANARRAQLRAQNQLPAIEEKIVKDTKKLDTLKERLAAAEKELEAAKQDPKRKFNAVEMSNLNRAVRMGRSEVTELEEGLKATRANLATTRQKAGIAEPAKPATAAAPPAPAPAAPPAPAPAAPPAPAPAAPRGARQSAPAPSAPAPAAPSSKTESASPQPLAGSHSGEPTAGPGTGLKATKKPSIGLDPSSQVKEAGLKVRPWGDVYQGGPITDTALSLAKTVQNEIEGFGMWTGLNDVYHQQKHPRSTHAVGRGLDMVLSYMPTPEQAQKIKEQILQMSGVKSVFNEYYKPPLGDMNQYTTGPHFHIDAQASEGGYFTGPKMGYPVEMHGDEFVIPKLKMAEFAKNYSSNVQKTPLENINAPSTQPNTDMSKIDSIITIQTDLMNMIASKLDNLDSRLAKSNDIQEDILTYSAS